MANPGATLCWRVVSPLGPSLAYHVAAAVHNTIYIHGGIDKKGSTKPLGSLYRMVPPDTLWQEVRAPNAPTLSHHACVVLENRYILLIGGWDGHKRCTDIHVFDTQEQCWQTMRSSGFPPGAGLSSHTALLLQHGDILVIGREGSTRLQRRTGNAFLLRGNVLSREFKYSEYPITVGSRSGHTAHILGNALYLYGGRSDNVIESHQGFHTGLHPCSIMADVARQVPRLTPLSKAKIPGGRKHHISVAGAGVVLIYGGETFDGRSREPVGEMILMTIKPHMSWYRLGTVPEGRAGHVSIVTDKDIFIHGGEGARGVVYGTLHKLDIVTDLKVS